MNKKWLDAQEGEKAHWQNENPDLMICQDELHGQVVGYAKYLGLEDEYKIKSHVLDDYSPDYYKNKRYDLKGQSVVDLGGGPTSLLLRCKNFSRAIVVDPLPVTDTVKQRYKECGIELVQAPAEDFKYPRGGVDEVWDYNCLHHVMDPDKILKNAKENCKILRIYEILETNLDYMHLHSFTQEFFDKILGVGGSVKEMNEPAPSPRGKGYYHIWKNPYTKAGKGV